MLYGDGGRHGVCFLPDDNPRARVLLLSPLFEEKRSAHRALRTCARALAAAGAAVLIPDLTGQGNSAGTLDAIDLAQWRDDLATADAYLRARADVPLCCIAVRAAALLVWDTEMPLARLLLCQPVLAGKSYLRQLRTRRKIQDALTGDAPPVDAREIEGVILSDALFTGLEALVLPEAPPAGDVCLLQCAHAEKLQVEYARLTERWPGLRTRGVVSEPFWNAHTPGGYADLAAALVEESVC